MAQLTDTLIEQLRAELAAANMDPDQAYPALCTVKMFGSLFLEKGSYDPYIIAYAFALRQRWAIPMTMNFSSPDAKAGIEYAMKKFGYLWPPNGK